MKKIRKVTARYIWFIFIAISYNSLTAMEAEANEAREVRYHSELLKALYSTEGANTNDPRRTMATFLDSMDEYLKWKESRPEIAKERLQRAVQCLNLEDFANIIRANAGKETALLLKEIFDRLWDGDLSQLPGEEAHGEKIAWRFGDTGIEIERVESGIRKGEYLFSKETVLNAGAIYRSIRHMPYLEGNTGAGYVEPWYLRISPSWLKKEIIGFAAWQWVGIFMSIPLGLFFLFGFRAVYRSIEKWIYIRLRVDKTFQKVSISRPASYLSVIAFFYMLVHMLRFEGESLAIFLTILRISLSLTILWLVYIIFKHGMKYLEDVIMKAKVDVSENILSLLSKTVKVIIIILAVTMVLQNLGVNVGSILAGFGLGGLAFALAAKDTASNFFGSITILIDRPFKAGDWIVMNETEGTVEDIGLRSTRIRTFYDSLVSVPNSIVATANIDNLGQRKYRRVKTVLGVDYATSADNMEAFLEGIKQVIKANNHTRKDYFHVVFQGFGPDSLNVMLYFFLSVPEWSQELVEKQNIYLEIMRLADDLGIRFAFPTQSIHIESMPGKIAPKKEKAQNIKALLNKVSDYSKGGKKARPEGQGIFTPPFRENES